MDKYILLVTSYPTQENPMAYAFVHSRIQQYVKAGICVDVVKVEARDSHEYTFEGILVKVLSKESTKKLLASNHYNKILVHILSEALMDIIDGQNAVVWVHGSEVISWRRYLFEKSIVGIRPILRNIKKRLIYRDFVINNKKNVSYVFVSEWMKNVAMADLHTCFSHSVIIPNYIDNSTFSYQSKNPEQRKKILVVRSFQSKKYAPDLIKRIIIDLSHEMFFNDLEFQIVGDGKYFDDEIGELKSYKNIVIHRCFITHEEIALLHKQFGIFLCPTRMDAQGVSMCEAMSSGLVPISSNNTAIPEFVENNYSGILCRNDNIDEYVNAIRELYYNANKYLEISENASNAIIHKCGYDETIKKEIDYILR